MKYLTLKNILVAAFIIGVVILVIVLFKGKKSNTNNNEGITLRDSLISAEKSKQPLFERIIEESHRANEALQQIDSLKDVHDNQKDIQIKQLNEIIKNIPNRISRLNNNADSIARAFADF